MASDPHLDPAAGAGVHHDLDTLHHVKRHVADLQHNISYDLQSGTGFMILVDENLKLVLTFSA